MINTESEGPDKGSNLYTTVLASGWVAYHILCLRLLAYILPALFVGVIQTYLDGFSTGNLKLLLSSIAMLAVTLVFYFVYKYSWAKCDQHGWIVYGRPITKALLPTIAVLLAIEIALFVTNPDLLERLYEWLEPSYSHGLILIIVAIVYSAGLLVLCRRLIDMEFKAGREVGPGET